MKKYIFATVVTLLSCLPMMLMAQNAENELKVVETKTLECFNKNSRADMVRYIKTLDNIKYTDAKLDQYYYAAKFNYCRMLAEDGEMNAAIDVALQMGNRARATNSKEGDFTCYEALGVIYFYSFSYDMSIEAFQTALMKRTDAKLLTEASETRILAYMLLACARDKQWNVMDEYLPHFWKNGYELMFNSLNILRQCYDGKSGGADNYVKEAEKYKHTSNRIALLAYDEAMARYYAVTNQYDMAVTLLQSMYNRSAVKDPNLQESLSSLYLALGDADKAEEILHDASAKFTARNYTAYIDKLSAFQRSYPLKSMEFAKQDDVKKVEKKKYYIEIVVLLLLIVAIIIVKFLTSQSKNLSRSLKQTEIQLKKDKEDFVQKERKLSVALQKTNNNIEVKGAFLSNMTHEIRTPLNSILGFSELISSLASNEEHKEYAEYIRAESNRLLVLVNNILDLARIDSGRMKLAFDECNVSEIIREAVFKVGENKNISVKVDCPEELSIKADMTRLLQVVTNIVSNAFKFAKKGEVRITVKADGPKMTLRCEDDGPGISPECSELVFERFEKLGSFEQGTGLGLSICRGIAKMFGGRIYLDTTYRHGAAFMLELPLDCSLAVGDKNSSETVPQD